MLTFTIFPSERTTHRTGCEWPSGGPGRCSHLTGHYACCLLAPDTTQLCAKRTRLYRNGKSLPICQSLDSCYAKPFDRTLKR
jgi:hypothetical protein